MVYSACIVLELDNGKDFESSVFIWKCLYLSFSKENWSSTFSIILHRKKKATFIKEAISGLEPLDPFSLAVPLSDKSEPKEVAIPANEDVDPSFASPKYIEDDADADGKWVAVDNAESLNNISDVLAMICDHSNIW